MEKDVKKKFESYPNKIRPFLENIREMILDVAEEQNIGEVTETLKWGEPSYSTKQGSAVRLDWKQKNPDQYAIYFNCKTTLIGTFKELYGDLFTYAGNRAIVFGLEEKLPEEQLRQCLSMALRYKNIKNLALLGA